MLPVVVLRRALLASCALVLAVPSLAHGAITVGFDPTVAAVSVAVSDSTSQVTLAGGAPGVTVAANATITPASADCTVDVAGTTATCTPPAGVTVATIDYTGGAGPDTLTVSAPFDLPITADGGPGNDHIMGGDGNDVITGGAGTDSIDAGAGNDGLDTFDGEADAPLACGAGADQLFADNFLDALDPACEVIAPEFAANDPVIAPADAVVGATLTATAAPTGTASSLLWQWFSCDPTGDLGTCFSIPGANSTLYTLTADDVGSTVRAGAEASNAAGFDQNISAPSGVVHMPSAATPLAPPVVARPVVAPSVARPAPRRQAFRARVAAIRCGGRACRVTLALTGPVSRVRLDLRHGNRRLARVTRAVRARTLRVTLRTRRPLARGAYVIAGRLTASDGRTSTFRRTVRVR